MKCANLLNEARRLKSRGMNAEAGRVYLQCIKGNNIAHVIE